jgi:protein-S-isoprenylcysteine O-methyltransferase Ste14
MLRCRNLQQGKANERTNAVDLAFMGLDCVGNSYRSSDVHKRKWRQTPRSGIAALAVDRHRVFGDRMLLDSGHRACDYFRWSTLAKAAKSHYFACGFAIRWMAVITLGKSFSANVAIRESQSVRRTGLYRFVRHPSYLGMLLIFLAIGLHSRNWASLAVALIPTTLALFYRIQVEEAALLEAFGDEYAACRRVTKRLLPGVF